MHKVISKRLFVRGNTHVITHNPATVCPPMRLDQCYSCRNRSSDQVIFQSVSAALPRALNIHPLTSIPITMMIIMMKDCATVLLGHEVIILPTTKNIGSRTLLVTAEINLYSGGVKF